MNASFTQQVSFRVLSAVALASLLCASLSLPAHAQGRGQPKDPRVKSFPNRVSTVVRAPDDRVFHISLTKRKGSGTNEIRDALNRAKGSKNIDIKDWKPILMQPDGTLWFYKRAELAGIVDGNLRTKKTSANAFISHGTMVGNSFGHRSGRTQFMDGVAYFPDDKGVHEFQNGKWAFVSLLPRNPSSKGRGQPVVPTMSANQETGRLLATIRSGNTTRLWSRNRGKKKWEEIPLGWLARKEISKAIPFGDNETLLFTSKNGIYVHGRTKTPKEELQQAFDAGVEAIRQGSPEDRLLGYKAVRELGGEILPLIDHAFATDSDPEVLYQLKKIRDDIHNGRSIRVGNAWVRGTYPLGVSEDGRFFVGVDKARAGNSVLNNCIMVISPDESLNFIEFEDADFVWSKVYNSRMPNAIVLADGKKVVLSGGFFHEFDLEARTLHKEKAPSGLPWIQTVLPDGSYVVSSNIRADRALRFIPKTEKK